MELKSNQMLMIIRELLVELGDLKKRVAKLENALADSLNSEPPSEDAIDKGFKAALRGESYDQLGALYKEGYHVCPVAYGEARQEDCLFCSAFMSRA